MLEDHCCEQENGHEQGKEELCTLLRSMSEGTVKPWRDVHTQSGIIHVVCTDYQ